MLTEVFTQKRKVEMLNFLVLAQINQKEPTIELRFHIWQVTCYKNLAALEFQELRENCFKDHLEKLAEWNFAQA
jgi:hypothetical protein